MEEAKKMKCYKRLIYKQFVQVSGLCDPQFLSYLPKRFKYLCRALYAGADPGFFLGGGALLSCSTSTPISHIVWQNTSCIRKSQVISGGVHTPCTLPLDPPLVWRRHIGLIWPPEINKNIWSSLFP